VVSMRQLFRLCLFLFCAAITNAGMRHSRVRHELLCVLIAWSQTTGTTTEGLEFLVKNAQKEGIVVLPSGLQYMVLASGPTSSPHPAINSPCKCNYKGSLIDGTVFDTSYGGAPLTLTPGDV
jgi:FKBP-type peptidyl-prolyl cis-trans isomerase